MLLLGVVCFAGCAKSPSSGGSGGGGGPTPNAVNLTGNWQFQVTSAGNVPLSGMSGFVNEEVGSAGDSSLTTASLQVQSSSCFGNSKVLDLEGFTKDPYSQLTAFPSYAQTLTLNLSQMCTGGDSLCGSYQVSGGCADGMSGQLVGVLYAPLTGTFKTGAGATPALAATIAQAPLGSGQGGFEVSGMLAFTGTSCLTTGTIDPTQSYLSGSYLHLVAKTDAANMALLTADGTMNASATHISLNSISLAGNGCLSSLNGAGLS